MALPLSAELAALGEQPGTALLPAATAAKCLCQTCVAACAVRTLALRLAAVMMVEAALLVGLLVRCCMLQEAALASAGRTPHLSASSSRLCITCPPPYAALLQEAALASARRALEEARQRAPVRPQYGEFVFQSRWAGPLLLGQPHSCGTWAAEGHRGQQPCAALQELTYWKTPCHAVTAAGCRPDNGIRASAGTATPHAPGQQRDAEGSSRTDAALHEALARMSGDDLPASFDEGDGPTGSIATAGESSHAASHAWAALRPKWDNGDCDSLLHL